MSKVKSKNKNNIYTIQKSKSQSFLSKQWYIHVFILPHALQLWVLLAYFFFMHWEKQMSLLFVLLFYLKMFQRSRQSLLLSINQLYYPK